MLLRGMAAGLLADLAPAVWTPASRGEQTLRLGLNVSAPTMTLAGKANADEDDTLLVHRWRHFGGCYGGFYGGGFYGGGFYGGGFYGGGCYAPNYAYYPSYS